MIRYLSLLAVLCVSYEKCKATYSLDEKITKYNSPTCENNCINSCENNCIPTRGALDCSEFRQWGFNESGIYTIWPASRITANKAVYVYCDMQTDGGGWTLIQRRGHFESPVEYFYKDWKSYKEGFGNLEEEFWLGNDNIFALSNQNLYSARFDLRDVEKNTRYELYDTFWIEDESRQYTLHIADYSGDAGDSMTIKHNDQKFFTKDRDNLAQCAQTYKGGWWYSNCHSANLNGLNLRGQHESHAEGINWYTWKGYRESLSWTEIKIRPKNFGQPDLFLNTPV